MSLLNDLRLGMRWLGRSPAFSAVAGLSLALGVGFNTALFSVVDAVLFRPLPVRDPGRLVDVYTNGVDGDQYATTSYLDYLDFRAQASVFEDMVAHSAMFAMLSLPDRSRLALGEVVSGNYFQALGVVAERGRTLLPEDDRPDAAPVVVVSHAYWQRELGGDPAVVGRTIRLRGQVYSVAGVTPAAFTGMTPVVAPEIWLPLARATEVEPVGVQDFVPSPTGTTRLDRRGQRWLSVKGRLKPGGSVAQAEANLDLIMGRLVLAHPQTNKDRYLSVKATRDVRVHPSADTVLLPAATGLMVLVGLVLLVACANVASMLLARGTSRRREVAIRLALGATRGHIVRQLLTESLLLALGGGVLGALLAWLLTRAVNTLDLPIPIPISVDLRIDVRVLLFTLAAAIAAGLIAGLAPAIRASKPQVSADLRGEAGLATLGRQRWTLRDVLVAGQVAMTLVLLVCATLFGRSLVAGQAADVGFETSGLAIVSTDVEMAGYDDPRAERFWKDAVSRVAALPGVQAVGLAARLPFSLNFHVERFFIPDRQSAAEKGTPLQNTRVSPGYFGTLGIPLLEGRNFTEADTPQSPGVVIVNETMAKRFWPGQSAVGRQVRLRDAEGPVFEIVGVAGDHRVQTVGEAPQPYVHFAQTQQPRSYQTLIARTSGDAGAMLGQVRRALLEIEPRVAFLDNQTMDGQVAATLLPARAGAWVVGTVGLVAMLLASVGLYGTIAYSVSRRQREIGIRMALGASRRSVVASFMRRGFAVTSAGLLGGAALALGAAAVLAGSLYGITAADPVAWLSSIGLLVAVSGLANLVPARRAAAVHPGVALRSE